ncbi:MAG: hypothetical protein U9N83_03040 [Thermodesulfobacteriota bacterium]|nr:hypothetical protein [Thermodesulfobacteriota bacterium]
MPEAWYEIVGPEISLTQGDIIFNCPLLAWQDNSLRLEGADETEVLKDDTTAIQADVVVMTQACDLEHEKVGNVILCQHVSLDDHRAIWELNIQRVGQNPTAKAWNRHCNDICDGFMWNLTMLNDCQINGSNIGIRIVFFNEVYTVPRSFLESLLKQRGHSRFRLLPPYREHLSQAFARFFMRVGLPIPIEKKWKA